MRRSALTSPLLLLALLTLTAVRVQAQDHQHHAQKVPQEQLAVYAKAHAAIGKVRDQIQAEMAEAKNKKPEAQQQLHEKMLQEVAKVLKEHNFTEEQYKQITFAIATDPESRKAFDAILGIAGPPPSATMSANPHVGHVMNSFNGTPNSQGLLPTALVEAKIVVQHAGLAARNTTSLDAMKQHAGHVLHALEPAAGATGPGAGYGLKKAVAGVVQHIELAATVQGAPAAVMTHATHIATSARNVVTRVDQMIALAKQVQSSSSAADAAKLITQLNTLAGQLIGGVDANGDGTIGWQQGEGGLQHVEQHLGLLAQAG